MESQVSRSGVVAITIVCLLGGSAAASELPRNPIVAYVRHEPALFEPGVEQAVSISFRMLEPGDVAVRIFDGRHLLVREISLGVLAPGDHEIRWDGRDAGGEPVPPEAYRYTLRVAATGGGPALEWNPPAGRTRPTEPPPAPVWDRVAQRVSYRVPHPSRVVLRAGLEGGGPLIRTLVNWTVRPPGTYEVAWDGRDRSGAVDVASLPGVSLRLQLVPLGRNVVIVGPLRSSLPRERASSTDDRWAPPGDVRPPRSIDELGDVDLTLQRSHPPDHAGGHVFRVDVPGGDRDRMLTERFEIGFFIDGVPTFENEVAYLPMSWAWNSEVGAHWVTANLWGYRGSMGTASIRVGAERAPGEETDGN